MVTTFERSGKVVLIGGLTPGAGVSNPLNGYDRINISGAAMLGGLLEAVDQRFHAAARQHFRVLNCPRSPAISTTTLASHWAAIDARRSSVRPS
jgi:hypothetical protein